LNQHRLRQGVEWRRLLGLDEGVRQLWNVGGALVIDGFCQRQQRISAERVEKVVAVLREKLSSPPPLEELGRAVGCSPFHLSRTFSTATGMTIPQYTRQLRLERAADGPFGAVVEVPQWRRQWALWRWARSH